MTNDTHTRRFIPLATHNVNTPARLIVRATDKSIFEASSYPFGYTGERLFGTAFIQGNRLQFATAMPMGNMLNITQSNRAKQGMGVAELEDHTNRPRNAQHATKLRDYLVATACIGDKFILPSFTLNYGDSRSAREITPDATLLIYCPGDGENSNGWPAMLSLPHGAKLDITDGAHREGEITTLLATISPNILAKMNQEEREKLQDRQANLQSNAVAVTIVFEENRLASHQDFADCGRAKPIAKSMVVTFDVRDALNNCAVALIKNVPFLNHYTDATAANVNLSAKSAKIWSTSAVKTFVQHVQDSYPPYAAQGITEQAHVELALNEKLQGAEAFFAELFKHQPELHTLDLKRDPANKIDVSTGDLRTKNGGNVALRGVGMAIFARAFLHCKQTGMPFAKMAERLAEIDYHILKCPSIPAPQTETERAGYAKKIMDNTNPLWTGLLVVGENRYRIGSSNIEADGAWARVLAEYFPEEKPKIQAMVVGAVAVTATADA